MSRPPLNLRGQRVGRLVPLRLHAVGYWLCACDCGTRPIVATPCLRKAETRSCGCLRAIKADKAGLRFGRLVALERAPTRAGQPARWRCQCDCGETHVVSARDLMRGDSRSCGCLLRETAAAKLREHRRAA